MINESLHCIFTWATFHSPKNVDPKLTLLASDPIKKSLVNMSATTLQKCTYFSNLNWNAISQLMYPILLFKLYFPSQQLVAKHRRLYTLHCSRCWRVLRMCRLFGVVLILLVSLISLSACVKVVKSGFHCLHIFWNAFSELY